VRISFSHEEYYTGVTSVFYFMPLKVVR